jgi:hypothetical protein
LRAEVRPWVWSPFDLYLQFCEGDVREKLYKFAIGLTICFVFDGLFMAWAVIEGGYTPLGYGQLSFFPVFIPSVLVALVVTGIYVYGFARLSWAPRRLEWLFFLVFAFALAVKLYIYVARPFD